MKMPDTIDTIVDNIVRSIEANPSEFRHSSLECSWKGLKSLHTDKLKDRLGKALDNIVSVLNNRTF